jgi:hypothetical protein
VAGVAPEGRRGGERTVSRAERVALAAFLLAMVLVFWTVFWWVALETLP